MGFWHDKPQKLAKSRVSQIDGLAKHPSSQQSPSTSQTRVSVEPLLSFASGTLDVCVQNFETSFRWFFHNVDRSSSSRRRSATVKKVPTAPIFLASLRTQYKFVFGYGPGLGHKLNSKHQV